MKEAYLEKELLCGARRSKKRFRKKSSSQQLNIPAGVLSHVEEILTEHAWKRMAQRGISIVNVAAAMMCGSFYHGNKAEIIVVGKKECRSSKYDLQAHRGIHLVLKQGKIVTTYRNRRVQLRYRS